MKIESLWLSEIKSNPSVGLPLDGNLSVDVAIIGGGYVGLWSALWLKSLDPSLQVAVFDKDRIGHGASGLNGGFMMSWWPKIGRLTQIAGNDDGLWLADQTTQNIDEIHSVFEAEQLDGEIDRSGWIWSATSPRHIQAWKGVVDATRRLGRGSVFSTLTRDDVARRAGSKVHIAGVFEAVNGKVHPAKLAHGLGVIAARRGIRLYENAAVDDLVPGQKVKLKIGRHVVSAEKVIVASNIAAEHMKELRRSMVLVTSAMVATPPIPDRLQQIGWIGGETVTDSQARLNYYRTTRSGRIAYGMGVGTLSFGNRLTPAVFADTSGIRTAERHFRRVYPMLNDVPLEFGWSGPIDRTYDSLPLIGRFHNSPNIIYGVGWSGNGVGPSRIGARIMAGLALDRKERWTENAFVDRLCKKFPPEPFRYYGGSTIRAAVIRKDECEIEGHEAPLVHRMLARLAPAGTEDKN